MPTVSVRVEFGVEAIIAQEPLVTNATQLPIVMVTQRFVTALPVISARAAVLVC